MFHSQFWRWSWAPTPSEWQAFWGFLTLGATLVALAIAIGQLRKMAESNQLSNQANIAAARAAEDNSKSAIQARRPYVVVRLELMPLIPNNPRSTADTGMVFVVIENIGQTTATNLRLKSEPCFEASRDGIPDEETYSKTLNWLREKFSGDYNFKSLAPGQKLSYVLDTATGMMDLNNALPQSYEITSTYFGSDENGPEFSDGYILEAEPWYLSIIFENPLEVIASQFRRLNQVNESNRKK